MVASCNICSHSQALQTDAINSWSGWAKNLCQWASTWQSVCSGLGSCQAVPHWHLFCFWIPSPQHCLILKHYFSLMSLHHASFCFSHLYLLLCLFTSLFLWILLLCFVVWHLFRLWSLINWRLEAEQWFENCLKEVWAAISPGSHGFWSLLL